MKKKEINLYKKLVETVAEMSTCNILKVGAIIVKNNSVISYGYNGTPIGDDNNCECQGETIDTVIHAEQNALYKCASSNSNCKNAVVFCTHAPCIRCAVAMYQSKIKKVYYINEYKNRLGIDFLNRKNVKVEMI